MTNMADRDGLADGIDSVEHEIDVRFVSVRKKTERWIVDGYCAALRKQSERIDGVFQAVEPFCSGARLRGVDGMKNVLEVALGAAGQLNAVWHIASAVR